MQPELNFAEDLNSTRGDQQPVSVHAAVTRNLDSTPARAQVDTHGLSRLTAVFTMCFLCQWEGEGLPWHWGVQTGTFRSFQRNWPNLHLFRTQSHKALYVFDLFCWAGWKELLVSHTPHHTGVGLPGVSRVLSPIKDSRFCLIHWMWHG